MEGAEDKVEIDQVIDVNCALLNWGSYGHHIKQSM